jgi:dolichol-phosphate mannosyltransferase
MKTLTVVCPVYNEEDVILAFHGELRRALAALESQWEWSVLYVVDRGTDRTLDLLRSLAASDGSVRVLALSSHFGQQASILAGLDHGDADAVVMMDADLQHPPALVPELVARHEEGHDVVHTVREDTSEIPLLKRLSARWFYRLVNAISDTPIREGAADFRLVSRRVAEVFRRDIRERGLFLRGLFSWVGFPSCTVRFRVGARGAGRTKYSLGRMVRFGLGGVVAFSRVPLRAAGVLGLLLAAAGLLGGGVVLWDLLRHGAPPADRAVLLVALALVSGVQLVFLGILGEYVGAVLDEARARPHYVVQERIGFSRGPDRAPGA